MNRVIRLFCAVLFLVSTSPAAFSADIWPMFHELKNSDESFEVTGVVCEEVAKLELEEQYPASDYEIVTGVAYSRDNRVLGELDVVVFRRADGEAILVGEVKCWKSLSGARKKAASQLRRFRENIDRIKGLELYDVHAKQRRYRPSQFDENPELIAIAQKGSTGAGFDVELGYSLQELMRLRGLILDCQDRGKCSGPMSEE